MQCCFFNGHITLYINSCLYVSNRIKLDLDMKGRGGGFEGPIIHTSIFKTKLH